MLILWSKFSFIGLVFGLFIASFGSITFAQDRTIKYERDIDPIFRKNCVSCHGPDRQENGLRLDTGKKALLGGYNGPVILPGMAAESSLMHFVLGIEEGEFNRMPMKAPPLEPTEIQLLEQWIAQGAAVEVLQKGNLDSDESGEESTGHWAFAPVLNPSPPAVLNRTWARSPIDRFVLSRLEREGLSPSAEADKAILFRRLSFDLTGLPPDPDEAQKFIKDNRPEAYQELVDRFLNSPRFGERWALQWLDLARYADSDGYEQDRVRPWAWRYRDWVIEALNSDMPFDQFTIDQIAGDLVAKKNQRTLMATGFHRNSLINREGGSNREQFRFEQTIDRTNTVATIWMGLTVGCAQCHDHKYDPISQKEYYQLFAFFNSLDDLNVDAPLPGELGPYLGSRSIYRAQRQKLLEEYGVGELQQAWEQTLLEAGRTPGQSGRNPIQSQIFDKAYDALLRDSRTKGVARLSLENPRDTLEADPSTRTQKEQDALTDHFVDNYRRVIEKEVAEKLNFKELRQKLFHLYDTYPMLTKAQAVVERRGGRETHIHLRGQWNRKGSSVDKGLLGVLPLPSSDKPLSRLALARWLVSRENPLTARVTVNRIWQELFGRGLVETSDDFGTQGSPPSHPQLLDWLATDFMESDWRVKQIIREIVTSATYRQSSKHDPDLVNRDPSNKLLARQARLRLKAELIRDAALTVSGLLERSVGGASVRPPQPKGTKEVTYAGSGKWSESYGPDRYRRGLYIHRQRTAMYPFLQNFDIPDTTVTSCRREVSNSPLQALNLLNDPVFMEAAKTLAYRILKSENDSFNKRLDYAFKLSLGRTPEAVERQRLKRYIDEQAAIMTEGEVAQLFPVSIEGVGRNRAAAWVGVSSILLNLDEFITRE
jgi:hypothetical protein